MRYLILFFLVNCSFTNKGLSTEEHNFLKQKKIALIGFYEPDPIKKAISFFSKSECNNSMNSFRKKLFEYLNSGNSEKVSILDGSELDIQCKSNEVFDLFFYGSKVSGKTSFDLNEKNKTKYNLMERKNSSAQKIMLKEYLRRNGDYVLDEVTDFIDKYEINKLYEKEFDYYIVGEYDSANICEKKNGLPRIFCVTLIPHLFTLGLFPVFGFNKKTLEFYIYDKNFKQIYVINKFDYYFYFKFFQQDSIENGEIEKSVKEFQSLTKEARKDFYDFLIEYEKKN